MEEITASQNCDITQIERFRIRCARKSQSVEEIARLTQRFQFVESFYVRFLSPKNLLLPQQVEKGTLGQIGGIQIPI